MYFSSVLLIILLHLCYVYASNEKIFTAFVAFHGDHWVRSPSDQNYDDVMIQLHFPNEVGPMYEEQLDKLLVGIRAVQKLLL